RHAFKLHGLGRGCKPGRVRLEERGAEAAVRGLAGELDDGRLEDAEGAEAGRRLGGDRLLPVRDSALREPALHGEARHATGLRVNDDHAGMGSFTTRAGLTYSRRPSSATTRSSPVCGCT